MAGIASAGSEAVAPQYATIAANPPVKHRSAMFAPIGEHGAVAPAIALIAMTARTGRAVFVVTSDYGERASLADSKHAHLSRAHGISARFARGEKNAVSVRHGLGEIYPGVVDIYGNVA
jgi:hypothetical protein